MWTYCASVHCSQVSYEGDSIGDYGPKGSKAMMDYLPKAYDEDIRIRVEDQGPVVAGRDLMEFTVEDKAVLVYDEAGKELMQVPRR